MSYKAAVGRVAGPRSQQTSSAEDLLFSAETEGSHQDCEDQGNNWCATSRISQNEEPNSKDRDVGERGVRNCEGL